MTLGVHALTRVLHTPWGAYAGFGTGATRLLPRLQDTGEADAEAVGVGESKIA